MSESSSIGASRGKFVVGVPKRCWCGVGIEELISTSEKNPYRRYFRCGFAVARKLRNDNHIFKWVDEAHLDEIERLAMKNVAIERELKEMTRREVGITDEFEKMLIDKVQVKIETEISEIEKLCLIWKLENRKLNRFGSSKIDLGKIQSVLEKIQSIPVKKKSILGRIDSGKEE